MAKQGHKGQGKVVRDIIRRAGLGDQQYLHTGHPDVLFRDGVRREIKAHSDTLTTEQRTQLTWMTEVGQPWEILKETHNGIILRFRNLQAYDFYQEYKTVICDWTQRVLPLGSVVKQKNTHSAVVLQTRCCTCSRLLWNSLPRLKKLGIDNIRCKCCSSTGSRNAMWGVPRLRDHRGRLLPVPKKRRAQ